MTPLAAARRQSPGGRSLGERVDEDVRELTLLSFQSSGGDALAVGRVVVLDGAEMRSHAEQVVAALVLDGVVIPSSLLRIMLRE